MPNKQNQSAKKGNYYWFNTSGIIHLDSLAYGEKLLMYILLIVVVLPSSVACTYVVSPEYWLLGSLLGRYQGLIHHWLDASSFWATVGGWFLYTYLSSPCQTFCPSTPHNTAPPHTTQAGSLTMSVVLVKVLCTSLNCSPSLQGPWP